MRIFGVHFEWWMFPAVAPTVVAFVLTGWGVFPFRPGLVLSVGLQMTTLAAIAIADQKGWL